MQEEAGQLTDHCELLGRIVHADSGCLQAKRSRDRTGPPCTPDPLPQDPICSRAEGKQSNSEVVVDACEQPVDVEGREGGELLRLALAVRLL